MGVVLTRAVMAGVLATSLHGCAYPRRIDLEELDRSLGPAPGPRDRTVDATAIDQVVSETGTLAAMIQLALARNAELVAERARVEELLARVPAAAGRPDPELKYEQWGVPLVRPYALNEADTVMIGVRQAFPAPGVLDAQQRAAAADAEVALYALRARQLDVARQLERAYLEYWLVDREVRIHREHVELAQHVVEVTRSRFRAGAATEQEVVRVGVELIALHRDIARLEQRKHSVIALLNALMGRSPSTVLTPAPPAGPAEVLRSITELQTLATEHRPEVLAAARGVERGRASTDAARAAATWPSFMVGVDYMYMPFMEERHAYGGMVSMSLPWLNSKHRDEVHAAERAVTAERRGVEAAAVTVRYEVEDAFARYQAARATYHITKNDLAPAARQSFESAQTGFAVGRGNALAVLEALRVLLDVRLDEVRDLFALSGAIADLKRAVGIDVTNAERTPAQGASHE
jgi:cobalt-zinc-cadmium efflux system outer membrane protein